MPSRVEVENWPIGTMVWFDIGTTHYHMIKSGMGHSEWNAGPESSDWPRYREGGWWDNADVHHYVNSRGQGFVNQRWELPNSIIDNLEAYRD